MTDRPAPAETAWPQPGGQAIHAIAHRPEIDGLRAFAIMPILLLHCGVGLLRGGFIGVDIFFVISGYLITAIITRELAAGTFTLAGFYRRRIVRILPALLVMVTLTLAAGCFLLLPVPLRELGRSAAAVAAFGSNFYFHATSDYFAQASDLKPLIHTWSLAVEEQFYLLFPLLLIALRGRSTGVRNGVLVALVIASFVIGGWQALAAPSAGFYLLPARVWELLLGALVALEVYPVIARKALREWLCWLALAGIVFCCFVIGSGWPFPVPFALPPAIGTAALLAYSPGTTAARFLAWRPFRAIGLISYSLYLWHRPIIAGYLAGRGMTLTAADTVILIAASFGAAGLSYALVERPALRRWRTRSGLGLHAAAVAALALVAAAGLAIASQANRIRQLPPPVAKVASYLEFEASPAGRAQFGTDRCFTIPTGKPFDPGCLALAPGRTNVLLVGDSHAAQLSAALRLQLAPGQTLLQATAAGCRPLLVGTGLHRCRAIVETAFRATDMSRVSAVILAGRWFDADVRPLASTVRYLRRRGVAVLVVGPGVEYDADMPDILARAMLAGDPARVEGLRLRDRAALDRKLAPIIHAARGHYVSQFAIECPDGRCRLMTDDGAPMHIDHSHLSPPAAEVVARAVADNLRR